MKSTLHLLRRTGSSVCRFTTSRSPLRAHRCVSIALVCASRACGSGGTAPRPPSSVTDARHTTSTQSPGKAPGAAASANKQRGEEDSEEDLRLTIYRPSHTPEQAERRAKTDVFLCLLLTLPRSQDWRDMLAAALRAATWRPHHLSAILRGVQLSKYNEPAAYVRSCAGASAPSLHTASSPSVSCLSNAMRAAIADAAATAPPTSTPTARLRRAREVLVFCAEEGPMYAPGTPESSAGGANAANAPSNVPESAYAPSAEAVHHLLALLLKAAQRDHGASSSASHVADGHREASETVADAGALPVASFHEVWHFLAWMELRNYHVLSTSVLDALEAAVDEGFTSPASPAVGVPPPPYAVVSQRVHRLEYLRGERARLKETANSGDSPAGATAPHSRRRESTPRTSPSKPD